MTYILSRHPSYKSQHERKIINAIETLPFVLSPIEGLREIFQQPVKVENGGRTLNPGTLEP